ncbi:MAG: type II secretion system protein [Fibrobacteria bacterium]|nr:type II secretion system protein [Fibrobacteria bacterium]
MKNQSGFTLIESLVTGILMVITAGVVLTFFLMTTRETREGAANVSMEKLYDVVSYNIGWKVRQAAAVLEANESFSSYKTYSSDDSVVAIETYDASGNRTGGYKINGTVLQELDVSAGSYDPMIVGNDTVQVKSGSSFGLLGGRIGLTMDLTFQKNISGKIYEISSRGDGFRCRNWN